MVSGFDIFGMAMLWTFIVLAVASVVTVWDIVVNGQIKNKFAYAIYVLTHNQKKNADIILTLDEFSNDFQKNPIFFSIYYGKIRCNSLHYGFDLIVGFRTKKEYYKALCMMEDWAKQEMSSAYTKEVDNYLNYMRGK